MASVELADAFNQQVECGLKFVLQLHDLPPNLIVALDGMQAKPDWPVPSSQTKTTIDVASSVCQEPRNSKWPAWIAEEPYSVTLSTE